MNHTRRPIERRRRVLLTTAGGDSGNVTAKQKAVQQQWREARRPAVAYGSRVRRCLRGRWFSLVPVQRSALTGVVAVVVCLAMALIGLHYASVAWPALAERTSVTAVTRIDAVGSLGRYCTSMLMLGIAGTSWLIYQLRRYRNDDFQGHYRLWRLVTAMGVLGSVATMVPLIDLLGGVTEWALGKRVALSGSDWVKLLLTVGGAVVLLRTTAEMWKHRSAAAWMFAGWLAASLPVAENWNLFTIDTPLRWTAFTSAMLIAASCWFCATVMYLRTLYMDVRGIQRPATLAVRFRQALAEQGDSMREWTKREPKPPKQAPAAKAAPAAKQASAPKPDPVSKSAPVSTAAPARQAAKPPEPKGPEKEAGSDTKTARKRRFWQRAEAAPTSDVSKNTNDRSAQSDDDRGSDASAHDENGKEAESSKRSSKWKFWGRKRKSADSEDESDEVELNESSEPDGDTEDTEPKAKRSWLPKWKRTPKAVADEESENEEEPTRPAPSASSDDEDVEEAPKKRRFGFKLPSLGRKAKSDALTDPTDSDDEFSSSDLEEVADSRSNAPSSPNRDSDDDSQPDYSEMDEEDIDWSGMNKAERRRVRKQLKRGGRAA
ncbi:hypothetical protein RISK_003461 [Rhodopirellula islandica]|uniref:Transmembrane protein n=1 Tax=Rhodopirellula islandica TaxID=595434 RepID=A0A0J1BCU4_RHOIS|nr:hypothetical protein [Rhodopirellula islandica]KLU04407.1 hypothetical protein RISK_003461 [Rhodopirellula islandica]